MPPAQLRVPTYSHESPHTPNLHACTLPYHITKTAPHCTTLCTMLQYDMAYIQLQLMKLPLVNTATLHYIASHCAALHLIHRPTHRPTQGASSEVRYTQFPRRAGTLCARAKVVNNTTSTPKQVLENKYAHYIDMYHIYTYTYIYVS